MAEKNNQKILDIQSKEPNWKASGKRRDQTDSIEHEK